MVVFLPQQPPSSLLYITRSTRLFYPIGNASFTFSRYGISRFRHFLRASLHSSSSSQDSQDEVQVLPEKPEIIFIGTGTSEGIPRVSCLTHPTKACPVCTKATEPGNKNRRLNTSLLVRYSRPTGKYNILIDAGKFFYHSALRWFPTFGIRNLDAVIITHSHADAIGGLDDLRDWTNNVQPHIPIYVAKRDFEDHVSWTFLGQSR